MIEFAKDRLKELSTWVGIVTLLAYVIMWFTPDHIDAIIMEFIKTIGGGALLASAGLNIVHKG